mmetsp:Transcript_25704/g.50334  ORF Transcript_25704/g.50334 Transcript_25704/m.50334 type:complete len:111 (+) Transcript_25704:3-335(+)
MALFGASIGNFGMSEAGHGFASQASTSCDAMSTLDCDAKQRSLSMAAAKGPIADINLLREAAMKAHQYENPEEIAQLRREHAEMKAQLEKIWMDVNAAAASGQDMVCWPI